MHYITGRLALDLHPNDIFWCTADPGWVTGTSYGIIAPLTTGATVIVDSEEFDAENLVPHPARTEGERLVYSANGRTYDDEDGCRISRPL